MFWRIHILLPFKICTCRRLPLPFIYDFYKILAIGGQHLSFLWFLQKFCACSGLVLSFIHLILIKSLSAHHKQGIKGIPPLYIRPPSPRFSNFCRRDLSMENVMYVRIIHWYKVISGEWATNEQLICNLYWYKVFLWVWFDKSIKWKRIFKNM